MCISATAATPVVQSGTRLPVHASQEILEISNTSNTNSRFTIALRYPYPRNWRNGSVGRDCCISGIIVSVVPDVQLCATMCADDILISAQVFLYN